MSKSPFSGKTIDVKVGKTTLTTALVSYLKNGKQLKLAILSIDGKLRNIPLSIDSDNPYRLVQNPR